MDISTIYSGYITRGKIEAAENGNYYLLQAKDLDGERLTYKTNQLTRFLPALSRTDRPLEKGDLLFMARGAHNFTVQIEAIPQPALAAACFFIVRISTPAVLPGYLGWYLNQAPVAQYLVQHSGRGVHMPVVRRAVLEDIDVPIPTMAVQTIIADMNALMFRELDLLQQLGRKRRELLTAACLRAIQSH
ncbi:MAG: hypothetical protein WAU91_08005 [Desulfatitalea sp.]